MNKDTSVSSVSASSAHSRLIGLVMGLFFAFGFCTVLVDTLIPKLKALFSLSYAEVMLTQFCFFGAYFLVSLPAAALLSRIGYLQSVTVGLIIMAVGCLLFTPAAALGIYPGFLGALFILAAGVTIVQVAANPLATNAGDPQHAHSRLTLAQALNSLATTVGPLFGAAFILAGGLETPDSATLSEAALTAVRQEGAKAVQAPFLLIAGALTLLAILCWKLRAWVPKPEAQKIGGYAGLLNRPRLMLGCLSIFVYVGAEVFIGSSMANYLMLDTTFAAAPQTAGFLVSVYWGSAMIGRFIGAGVLRRVAAGTVLVVCAICAALLAAISGMSTGIVAGVTLLAVGLFNSIMFPTIFALAVEGLGERVGQASGLLCLSIVGGAIIPVLGGWVADQVGLALALFVPVACYIWIGIYGVSTLRVAPASVQSPLHP
jgi:MFS transporter, FHS family, L-fucose permease